MEELLIDMILFSQGLIPESEYKKRLDELFLGNPENNDLIYLEWETDINKAVLYVRAHINCNSFNLNQFGKNLMSKLKVIYAECTDIKWFADRMYGLWESLPGNIQHIEPFQTLCYADDSLSWGDEEQTKDIYERMLNYYKN